MRPPGNRTRSIKRRFSASRFFRHRHTGVPIVLLISTVKFQQLDIALIEVVDRVGDFLSIVPFKNCFRL